MRRAFTGVEGSDGVDVCPACGGLVGVLSTVLSVDLLVSLGPVVFGRRLLLTFGVVLEPAGLSFGREVMNAPRTSSSWTIGAVIPIASAQTQTNPRTMTLNRIT
jgi:hypothetical protein